MSKISTIIYVVLALSIGYIFVLPLYQDVSQLLSQKTSYMNSLNAIDNIQNKKSELLNQFNQISDADKENLNTILPNSFDFVKLVSEIDAVAASHGISIGNITSKEIDPSVGDSIDTAQPSKPYNSAIIGFSFTTSYGNYRAFLSDLEKSMRILDITSTRLEAQDKGLYSVSVEFETYWYK